MRGHVVGCVPFDAADVGGRRHGWVFTGEVPIEVTARVGRVRRVCSAGAGWEGDDVRVMKEDPEHLFGKVVEFLVPDPEWAREVDRSYEAWWLSIFRW